MSKLYTCTVDGKTFETKKELMNYIYKSYVAESDSNVISEYYEKLKKAFPDSTIEITESEEDVYGKFYIEIYFKKINSYFNFYVGEYEESTYGESQFVTIEEALNKFKAFPETTNLLKKEISKVYDVQKFEVTQWSEGDLDSYSSISLELLLNGKEVYIQYQFEGIEKLMKRISSYFVTEIEGTIDIYYDHTDNSEVFNVDDIDLKSFLKGHKKARVIIIE